MLAHINRRWEAFFREKIGFLRAYAKGDDELVSIGLFAIRPLLEKHPYCPDSWLVMRAKSYILKEQLRRWNEVTPDYGTPDRYAQGSATAWEEKLQYEAMSHRARNPEVVVIDHLQYQAFVADLTEMEQRLLTLMREEAVLDPKPRYFKGKYARIGCKPPKSKKRFKDEVSRKIKDYTNSYANLRLKFYRHFGSDDEIEREESWYETFDHFGRLHANRNGHYDRKP